MILETGQLNQTEKRFTGEEQTSVLALKHDPFVEVKGPIKYDLRACLVYFEIVIRGMLEVELSCICSRCAERFSYIVKVAAFFRSYKLTAENESIDLTNDIREDILLSFPMIWVCSPTCRGLCSQCGVNLNKQVCSCESEKDNQVWSTLDQLNIRQ